MGRISVTVIRAKAICCSRAAETGKEIATLELVYPRYVHAEFMTHRVFSRNASSSRAIPMKKMHASIIDTPALPVSWTLNEPGMQGYNTADADTIAKAKAIIAEHRIHSIKTAEALAELGLHKQIFNRYTEAHQHIRVVVTSSTWSNFLMLRSHETAEPHMQLLAASVENALAVADYQTLKRGEWHLPYFDQEEFDQTLDKAPDLLDKIPPAFKSVYPPYAGERAKIMALKIAISAARCARVSYNNFEGVRSSAMDDIQLFLKLVGSQPIHASPVEHQATPDWKMGMA